MRHAHVRPYDAILWEIMTTDFNVLETVLRDARSTLRQ